MRKFLAIAACVLTAFLLPAQTNQSKNAGAPPGNADNGKKLFANDGCYQCHGREGQGGEGTGPHLGPHPIPFAQFERYVRAPTGQMPPYTAKVVSAQDLADIYAFLSSRPQPPAAKSLPQLRN